MTALPTLTLYDHPVSSYAQKVRIALRYKNLPFTAINPLTSSAAVDPAFLRYNPRGEVPVLLVHDPDKEPHPIVDSRIILQYLEDRFPASGNGALLPTSPEARAAVRELEALGDGVYEALNWGWGEVLWMGRARDNDSLRAHLKAEVQRQTAEILARLEGALSPEGYLSGSVFGLADMALAPIVYRTQHFGFLPEGSKMEAWLERVRRVEAVAETLREFNENVGGMAKASEIFYTGERKREYRDYRLEWLVKSGGEEVVKDGLERGNIRFPWPEGRSLEGKVRS